MLVETGVASRASLRLGLRRAVLAFHNVVPDDIVIVGERALHMRLSAFVELIEQLSRFVDFVPLDDVLRRPHGTRGIRVAITFDDAYRGALTSAVPWLDSRGIPSTTFVAPGLLGAEACWWDVVAGARSGEIPSEEREAYLDDERAGRGDRILKSVGPINQRGHAFDTHYGIVTGDELATAALFETVTFGGHSWSHPNLARLTMSEHAREELLLSEYITPMTWLRQHGFRVEPAMAYPYGRSSESAEKLAADAGFLSAWKIQGGGLAPKQASPYALPRINVPASLSARGALLRLARLRA